MIGLLDRPFEHVAYDNYSGRLDHAPFADTAEKWALQFPGCLRLLLSWLLKMASVRSEITLWPRCTGSVVTLSVLVAM